eukprot:gb/GFBE01030523.1/.p1 GENE.gb/GFBE01030523.1/~~gb/GFBE01030523.1/.p1  ORF type:complete len:179 (+),score=13.15 gb/GFBE01030523.1/:1-537(+)
MAIRRNRLSMTALSLLALGVSASVALLCALNSAESFVQAPHLQKPASMQMSRRSMFIAPAVAESLRLSTQPAQAAGSCNADDQKLWEGGVRGQMPDIMQKCLNGVFAKVVSTNETAVAEAKTVASKCASEKTGISPLCGNCFADLAECIVNKCAMRCLEASSASCIACVSPACTPCMV